MIRKILIAYDGSASADHALSFAVDLAAKFSAELHVLAVARPPELAEDVESTAVLEHSLKHYENVLDKARMATAGASIEQAVFRVVVGHPAEQIVRYAEGHQVDHIVVGHRGHTLFERWLIGSVARQVIAYAHCAVTVVRK
jgi:nucleotide-binding universal stress UspA family protein